MIKKWRAEFELFKEEWSKSATWSWITYCAILIVGLFLLIYVGYDFSTALAAEHFGFQPMLFFHKIHFYINDRWYPHAVKRVYVAGGIAVFVGWILPMLIYYLFRRRLNHSLRLLLIYTSLICGGILMHRIGMIPLKWNYNLGYYSAYSYHAKTTQWGFAVFSALLYVASAFLYVKPLLQTARNKEVLTNERSRRNYLLITLPIPIIIAWIASMVINLPYNAMPMSGEFMIMFIHSMFVWRIGGDSGTKLFRFNEAPWWNYVHIGLLVAMVLLYRTILAWGLDMTSVYQIFSLY